MSTEPEDHKSPPNGDDATDHAPTPVEELPEDELPEDAPEDESDEAAPKRRRQPKKK